MPSNGDSTAASSENTGRDASTIQVFESAERHGFGIVFVKGSSESIARTKLNSRVEHEGKDFDYLGTAETWLIQFRKSEAEIEGHIYYR